VATSYLIGAIEALGTRWPRGHCIWDCLASFLDPYPGVQGSMNHEAQARIDCQNYRVANIPFTVTVLPLDIEEPAILDLNGVDVSL
jgi:hypothetical protein